MADPADVLPVGDLPPVPIIRSTRETRACCEFCECKLTPGGEILEFSDKARRYRDQKETIDKRDATIAALESELTTLRADKRALEAKARPSMGDYLR